MQRGRHAAPFFLRGSATCPHPVFSRVDSPVTALMSEDLFNSPCIGVCAMGQDGYCLGCFRTLDEITRWLSFSEGERRRIVEALPQRLESLFPS